MRGATAHQIDDTTPADDFNSHTPCGVRPTYCRNRIMYHHISTHTPHAGCDLTVRRVLIAVEISTHTPHAGCDDVITPELGQQLISTHTPHAGCDPPFLASAHASLNFNSHTPCGVRPHVSFETTSDFTFQLTHPMRGATFRCEKCGEIATDFNSHTPCGVRLLQLIQYQQSIEISTHTPHAGCDVNQKPWSP